MIEHSIAIKRKTIHSIRGKRINSVCKENSAHVENLTNADPARPSKRRFDMKGQKNNLARNFPKPAADNMERRKHKVQREAGKVGHDMQAR